MTAGGWGAVADVGSREVRRPSRAGALRGRTGQTPVTPMESGGGGVEPEQGAKEIGGLGRWRHPRKTPWLQFGNPPTVGELEFRQAAVGLQPQLGVEQCQVGLH